MQSKRLKCTLFPVYPAKNYRIFYRLTTRKWIIFSTIFLEWRIFANHWSKKSETIFNNYKMYKSDKLTISSFYRRIWWPSGMLTSASSEIPICIDCMFTWQHNVSALCCCFCSWCCRWCCGVVSTFKDVLGGLRSCHIRWRTHNILSRFGTTIILVLQ